MHGIVLSGLKSFVEENYGMEASRRVQAEADVEKRLYVPVTDYPDEDALALVEAACEVTGEDLPTVLEGFGRYLVPTLLETYGVHVDGDWTSLELLANVEEYIHRALRAKQLSEFTPPHLGASRAGEDRVTVTYGSDRQLCPLARGIFHGVADHYGESFAVTERRCMLDGADACEFEVERVGAGGQHPQTTHD